MLTATELDTLHGLYHPTTKELVSNSGVNLLTEAEYDQLSGILSDYCVIQVQHMQALRGMPGASSASDLCQKWLERAADLRDKIEAR